MTPVRRGPGRIEVIAMSSPVDEPALLGPGTWDIDFTPAVLYTRPRTLCAEAFPRPVRFLTLYCGDPETALDLAQETCARGCAQW